MKCLEVHLCRLYMPYKSCLRISINRPCMYELNSCTLRWPGLVSTQQTATPCSISMVSNDLHPKLLKTLQIYQNSIFMDPFSLPIVLHRKIFRNKIWIKSRSETETEAMCVLISSRCERRPHHRLLWWCFPSYYSPSLHKVLPPRFGCF